MSELDDLDEMFFYQPLKHHALRPCRPKKYHTEEERRAAKYAKTRLWKKRNPERARELDRQSRARVKARRQASKTDAP